MVATVVFAGLVVYLVSNPPAAGCKQSLQMSTTNFSFTQECLEEIGTAAREAALQTGASEEVANAAAEAATTSARSASESGTSPSEIAQEIVKDTINIVTEAAVEQGEDFTTATKAARAAGAAAVFAALGASSPNVAEFAAAAANASVTNITS